MCKLVSQTGNHLINGRRAKPETWKMLSYKKTRNTFLECPLVNTHILDCITIPYHIMCGNESLVLDRFAERTLYALTINIHLYQLLPQDFLLNLQQIKRKPWFAGWHLHSLTICLLSGFPRWAPFVFGPYLSLQLATVGAADSVPSKLIRLAEAKINCHWLDEPRVSLGHMYLVNKNA